MHIMFHFSVKIIFITIKLVFSRLYRGTNIDKIVSAVKTLWNVVRLSQSMATLAMANLHHHWNQ